MHHFYSTQISNGIVILSAEEAHHALRVLRLQTGDLVRVFNGEGSIYKCRITELSKKEAILTIESENKAQFKNWYLWRTWRRSRECSFLS